MLSMLLCLSCVYVGMTAVFADDAEYTPVVSLTPEMYSPKTVYVDDDFNNRDTTNGNTDLTKIAEGKTAYEHPIMVKNAAGTSNITNFVLGSDGTDVYAAPTDTWKSLVLKGENNIDADRVAISFRFRFTEKSKSFQLQVSNPAGTAQKVFALLYTSDTYCELQCQAEDGSTIKTGCNTSGYTDWNRVYTELERIEDTENPGSYNVSVSKFYLIDGNGTKYDIGKKSTKQLLLTGGQIHVMEKHRIR